ncbi:DEAD/DEAH box helicase [Neolewinella antarctica]|uniref:ATP-dependent Lhr-like helicase n=1 Tax=Neolewinella antarctica TaxID=442734 RepID=A0ABX0XGA3_9BACT|nr:DEAD/DEAH box helicase [Neolewinella antarctica]NJC28335.1 ATP-dependent Lhr-like helicase [Neolewinella antarctica]
MQNPGERSPYDQLSNGAKKWIYQQGWSELRSLQAEAIPAILSERNETSATHQDVIITAATAGGKTEAAFLPIFSHLELSINDAVGKGSFQVLCISPLKALINDQYVRLKSMGESCKVAVHRRHGDVSATEKSKAFKKPGGVFLTTPESLEALFVRRSQDVTTWFANLDYIVVDELHVFIGSERGRQLQSLLHRVELATRRRPCRIALSATLGDMLEAGRFLRPGRQRDARVINDAAESSRLLIQVKGYEIKPPETTTGTTDSADDVNPEDENTTALDVIADDLFRHLNGRTNLAFANSRSRVEALASKLRERCEEKGIPPQFFPHHGNLSKNLRETLEARLKSDQITTAVCTSTLELGIDIGAVHTVAQITPPHGVASLRQRLGRSGRRDEEDAILRMYVPESDLNPKSPLSHRLRLDLVQSIAIVELLLRNWYEPERAGALHLSTLVQQIISVIVQHGGAHAKDLYSALCSQGPFEAVSPVIFSRVLKSLGTKSVIQQSSDGLLLLGREGEKISSHYTFYAAFETDREFTILHRGKKLGSIPINKVLTTKDTIVFAGKNWRVTGVDADRAAILVEPSRGGHPITFGGGIGQLHTGVVKQMQLVLSSKTAYSYLDSKATDLLKQGRTAYEEIGFAESWIHEMEGGIVLSPWLGDAATETLCLLIRQFGLDATLEGRFVLISGSSNNGPGRFLGCSGRT